MIIKKENLKISESEIFLQIGKKRKFYESKVNNFLINLNISNSSKVWWAFNFTARNPVTSKLFEKLIVVLAIIDIIESDQSKQIDFYKISVGQRSIINQYFDYKPKYYINSFYDFFLKNIFFEYIKIIYLLIEIFLRFFKLKNKTITTNILLFSYIDNIKRNDRDSYFGNLLNKITEDYPEKKVSYLFYLYRPFIKMKKCLKNEKSNYSFIFNHLHLIDYLWAFIQVINGYFFSIKNSNISLNNKNIFFKEIIRETMKKELSRGYINNLLVYRASKRIRNIPKLETLIYPFENKSLEKLMNLGFNNKIKTIGYQHSSITPRHFNFILNNDERNLFPLPNKVVTIGEVTKRWLIKKCNFPASQVIQGVALKNFFLKPIIKRTFSLEKVRLLFVFSSSNYEIIKSIEILKKILINYSFNCRFRFHINFPLENLNLKDKKWIKSNINLAEKNTLNEDLKWTDITVYISSTVALESLFCGIPIIRLDIDKFNSDPLLNEKIPFKWTANSAIDLINSICEISYLSDKERNERSIKGQNFASSYMMPDKFLKTEIFL
ncbi:MAG: hypothetical protein CMC88_04165 [Flavobacteriaceae bacterium]|nr:hypothetical protein [Flavobacteriaceae bacterium]